MGFLDFSLFTDPLLIYEEASIYGILGLPE